MIRIQVTAEAKQPLILGEGMLSSQNVRNTLDHIPGGFIRGAIAQAVQELLGSHQTSGRALGNASANLRSLFERCFPKVGGPRFGFLYPGGGKVIPGPVSALRCRQDGSHVFDKLLLLLQGEQVGLQCPECQGRLERARGYFTNDGQGWKPVKDPSRRSFVRVGLNRVTETAEDSFLFVLESVEHVVRERKMERDQNETSYAPLTFSGDWWFETEEQWLDFEKLLQEVLGAQQGSCELRIGSARARGFGKVVLKWQVAQEPVLSDCVDTFSHAVGNDKIYFTVMVLTPLLVFELNGQVGRILTPELLRHYVPGLPNSVAPVGSGLLIEREGVSGWSQMWGLPKPLYQAIARGSVFTYQADKTEQGLVVQWLQKALQQGIGERLPEGYGQVEVCSSFHIEHALSGNTVTQEAGEKI